MIAAAAPHYLSISKNRRHFRDGEKDGGERDTESEGERAVRASPLFQQLHVSTGLSFHSLLCFVAPVLSHWLLLSGFFGH